MGFIIYYLVLIVNPMGRILVRSKSFRNNLEMLCHPICNWRWWCWFSGLLYVFCCMPRIWMSLCMSHVMHMWARAIRHTECEWVMSHVCMAKCHTPHLLRHVTIANMKYHASHVLNATPRWRMCHFTHATKSCHICECSKATRVNESCHTSERRNVTQLTCWKPRHAYKYFMLQIIRSHDWYMNVSFHICEWVTPQVWTRNIAHHNCWAPYHAYKCVMSQMKWSHVTHMDVSNHICEWVMPQVWTRNITHHNCWVPCHVYKWDMSHMRRSHVTYVNDSSHTCAWVMPHVRMAQCYTAHSLDATPRLQMGQVTNEKESFHEHESFMSHIWIRLVTRVNDKYDTPHLLDATPRTRVRHAPHVNELCGSHM